MAFKYPDQIPSKNNLEYLGRHAKQILADVAIGQFDTIEASYGDTEFSWLAYGIIRVNAIDNTHILTLDIQPDDYTYGRGTLLNVETGVETETPEKNLSDMAEYMLRLGYA